MSEVTSIERDGGRLVLARYLERLMMGDKAAEPKASVLTEGFLAEHGYLKN